MRPRTTLGIDPTIGPQYPHLGARRRARPPRVLQGLGENPAALSASTVETLQGLLAASGSWTGGVNGDWTPDLVPAINDLLAKRQIPIPACDPQAAYAALRAAFRPASATRIEKAPFTNEELTALAEVYAAECATPADTGNGDAGNGDAGNGVPKPASWWKKNWGWVVGGVATAGLGIGGFLWWRRKQEQTGTAGLGCGCTSMVPAPRRRGKR